MDLTAINTVIDQLKDTISHLFFALSAVMASLVLVIGQAREIVSAFLSKKSIRAISSA